MVDKSVLMICRSIDNLAKEVRDLKRILLSNADIAIDGKRMKGLEDDVAYISVYEIGGDQE